LSGGNHSIPPSVRIVPNPASDRVKVTTLEQECRVEVSDEWGRRVFSAMTNDSGILEVDVRRLKQGIYLFRVFTRSGVHCQKVMVSG